MIVADSAGVKMTITGSIGHLASPSSRPNRANMVCAAWVYSHSTRRTVVLPHLNDHATLPPISTPS